MKPLAVTDAIENVPLYPAVATPLIVIVSPGWNPAELVEAAVTVLPTSLSERTFTEVGFIKTNCWPLIVAEICTVPV